MHLICETKPSRWTPHYTCEQCDNCILHRQAAKKNTSIVLAVLFFHFLFRYCFYLYILYIITIYHHIYIKYHVYIIFYSFSYCLSSRYHHIVIRSAVNWRRIENVYLNMHWKHYYSFPEGKPARSGYATLQMFSQSIPDSKLFVFTITQGVNSLTISIVREFTLSIYHLRDNVPCRLSSPRWYILPFLG